MRVIFLGTPDFGIYALQRIMHEHELVACVCQPDKVGSHGKVHFCAVKEFALEHNIPLYQFERISRDGVEILKSLAPDIMVTAAYGQILSQEIIDIPKHGIVNIHGSLLPELRGAAPIQYAILKGMQKTGITILNTVREVDAGEIILQKPLIVAQDETSGELFERMAVLGAHAISEALYQIENGTAVYTPQDNSKATFSQKITAEQENINWNMPAQQILNLIHALSPNVGAYTSWNGSVLKIYRGTLYGAVSGKSGEVVTKTKDKIVVCCGDGIGISVLELQLQGSRRMLTRDFNCGRNIQVGTVLGE